MPESITREQYLRRALEKIDYRLYRRDPNISDIRGVCTRALMMDEPHYSAPETQSIEADSGILVEYPGSGLMRPIGRLYVVTNFYTFTALYKWPGRTEPFYFEGEVMLDLHAYRAYRIRAFDMNGEFFSNTRGGLIADFEFEFQRLLRPYFERMVINGR